MSAFPPLHGNALGQATECVCGRATGVGRRRARQAVAKGPKGMATKQPTKKLGFGMEGMCLVTLRFLICGVGDGYAVDVSTSAQGEAKVVSVPPD